MWKLKSTSTYAYCEYIFKNKIKDEKNTFFYFLLNNVYQNSFSLLLQFSLLCCLFAIFFIK